MQKISLGSNKLRPWLNSLMLKLLFIKEPWFQLQIFNVLFTRFHYFDKVTLFKLKETRLPSFLCQTLSWKQRDVPFFENHRSSHVNRGTTFTF